MANIQNILFFAQLINIYVSAAPSDVSKLKEIANVETADIKLDTPVTLDEASKTSNNDAQGQRQKRFYNYYGFPPMNPVIYPNYAYLPENGGYGPEDPFSQIFRRLQDIAGGVRSPNFNQPPPPPPIPFLFPVIYIPYVGCNCSPQPPNTNKNGTNTGPGVENRFPEMDDVRQNWGIVVNPNDTVPDDGQEEDFTRPISFVPIMPIQPSRPSPPVEHGSSQGDGRDGTTTTTTVRPGNQYPPAAAAVPQNPPNNCDAAILSCCHQPQATYDCFVLQGCPDPTSYGNPCDSQVILSVIDKFSKFYGRRNTIG